MKNKDKYSLKDLRVSMYLDEDTYCYLTVKYNEKVIFDTYCCVMALCVVEFLLWLESESEDDVLCN